MRRIASNAIACLILFTLSVSVSCSRYHGMTEESVDRLISKELPPGTDQSQVVAFLDKQDLEHSELVEIRPEILENPDRDSSFNSPKLDEGRGRIKSYMVCKIPDVNWGFLTKWDIIVRFYFDEDGKVVTHQAKTTGTGP